MKPIEPGCLVIVIKTQPHLVQYIGSCFTVTGPAFNMAPPCVFCGSLITFPLSDDCCGCPCCLMRIDGDLDAVPQETIQEITA